MRNQEIKEIKIKDLKLWSENPRDPLDIETSDFDIIKNAVTNSPKKWDLNKLMKQIGEFYDFSELPIVVEINGEYIVYDGNRRISIIKYLQDEQRFNKAGVLIKNKNKSEFLGLKKIPCNVCSLDVALDNIERKHTDNGTWNELERDYFKHIHRKEEKSLFIKIDEATKIITKNPKLNQGFVKREVLTRSNLESIGLGIDANGEISTIYDKEFTKEIIEKIVEIINSKQITTRKNRGELKEILEKNNLSDDLNIYSNQNKKYTLHEVYPNINYINTNLSASATSNSATSNSVTSNSVTSNSVTSNSVTSNSVTSNSVTSNSATSNSATSNSATVTPSLDEESEKEGSNTNPSSKYTNRTPAKKNEDLLFGGKLILKSGKVNNLYRAIEIIYESSINNEIILPIVGMSLRLILELVAREYYEETGEEIKNEDQIMSKFLRIAKKEILEKQTEINFLSMTNDWLDNGIGLDGVLGKYAHGNIIIDRGNIIKHSIIVGQIIEFYQGKNN